MSIIPLPARAAPSGPRKEMNVSSCSIVTFAKDTRRFLNLYPTEGFGNRCSVCRRETESYVIAIAHEDEGSIFVCENCLAEGPKRIDARLLAREHEIRTEAFTEANSDRAKNLTAWADELVSYVGNLILPTFDEWWREENRYRAISFEFRKAVAHALDARDSNADVNVVLTLMAECHRCSVKYLPWEVGTDNVDINVDAFLAAQRERRVGLFD